MPGKAHLWILIIAVIAVALTLINSIQPGCVIRNTTGVLCPGCGGKRAMGYFLNGDFLHVLKSNLLFLPAVALIVWSLLSVIFSRSFKQVSITKRTSLILFLIATVYTIVRNLDGMTILRP